MDASSSSMPSPVAMNSSASLASLGHRDKNKASALDINQVLYTSPPAMSPDRVSSQRDFRPNSSRFDIVKASLEDIYELDAVYENPIIALVSRKRITDVHSFVNSTLLNVSFPHPLWLIRSTIGGGPPTTTESGGRQSLFRISEIWSEVVEISESESFDRSRKVYLEHKFHLLVLPGLHDQSSLRRSTLGGLRTSSHFRTSARLKWFSFLPSPLHFRLRVTSRFTFNDAGRVTYHRDLWDIKDIAQMLIPWSRPFIFIITRIAGFLLWILAISLAWGTSARWKDESGGELGSMSEPQVDEDELHRRQAFSRVGEGASVDMD